MKLTGEFISEALHNLIVDEEGHYYIAVGDDYEEIDWYTIRLWARAIADAQAMSIGRLNKRIADLTDTGSCVEF